jgi:hypothetical protein
MIEAIGVIAAVLAAFYLAHLLVRRVWGVSRLCHFGLHRWQKVVVGQGRDARHVVKCRGCEILKDEA